MRVKHPELVIAGAVVVSLPMVPGILSGDIAAATAMIRFLIALVGCWVLASLLSWVVSTYTEQSRRAQIMRAIEAARADAEAAQPGGQERTP